MDPDDLMDSEKEYIVGLKLLEKSGLVDGFECI